MPAQRLHSGRIAALAAAISENSAIIEAYHSEHNITPPTFDPVDSAIDIEYPDEIQKSKTAILDATAELNDLLTGPRGLVSNPGFPSLVKFVTLRFLYRFKLVEKVPLDGEISYEELAKETGINISAVQQLLRAAMTFHLFKEKRPGYVSHTSVTLFLLRNEVLRDCTGFTTEDMLPACLGIVDALLADPAANDPSKSGYMMAHGASDPSFYMHLAKDPEKIRRFTNCMSQATAGPEWSLHYLTDFFDWASLGSGTVVDVGGSTGQAAFAIAKVASDLQLIVQDTAQAISAAQERPGIRVSHMVSDFFSEQVVKGADVYLFRSVFHNWPDAQAVSILQAQIPALKPGATVLIMDEVMPDVDKMSLSTARTQRMMDIAMLALGNSRIRDEAGWRDLCKRADSRLHVAKVTRPEGSHLALIEVVWKP